MKETFKFSMPQEYYICGNCGFGNKWEWSKPKGSFYNGNFIFKQCPRCNAIDSSPIEVLFENLSEVVVNSKKKKFIEVKGVDY